MSLLHKMKEEIEKRYKHSIATEEIVEISSTVHERTYFLYCGKCMDKLIGMEQETGILFKGVNQCKGNYNGDELLIGRE